MGPAREIFQEGVRIPPVKIARRGEIATDVLRLILANVRTPAEREGDLTAQVAACRVGERRLGEMIARYGQNEVLRYCRHMLDYSERMMRSVLRGIPDGTYSAEDFLDDDGITDSRLRIAATICIRGDEAEVDFAGTSPQCAGAVNAVLAITYSAVFYVFRCLVSEEVPATSGLMRPIRVLASPGTLVNAQPPAAVAGGNVETSQRTVDVLLRALAKALPHRIPAASQGTMNNLTLGGWDRRRKAAFAYYETVAGGMGARPGKAGIGGIHTHMTNSLNTPVEALEFFYPLRVLRYGLRHGSGGEGKFRGGDGVIREIELLADAQLALLCDRRKTAPYGLAGGAPGKPGKNSWRFGRRVTMLPGKCTVHLPRGAVVRIETPGGGGWGRP
jgi:N-methylhydantoinase B